ncbi:MAG TPA: hypothetical protein VFE98_10030 [Candidatus Bathyarchaeia archaeon]|nr:hypothetical protein [Candidatus Bathyarchaeia archaeon]
MPTRFNRLFRLYAAQKKPLDLTFLLQEGDKESIAKKEERSRIRKIKSSKKSVAKNTSKHSPRREGSN